MKLLTVSAIIACVATGAHAAPTRDETVTYIKTQCDGAAALASFVTSDVQINGTVLSFTTGVPVDAAAKGVVGFIQKVSTIELADVKEIRDYMSFITLKCDYNCVRVETFYLGTNGKRLQPRPGDYSGTKHQTVINLYCRRNDRVANAIEHLQSLIADDDPFAN